MLLRPSYCNPWFAIKYWPIDVRQPPDMPSTIDPKHPGSCMDMKGELQKTAKKERKKSLFLDLGYFQVVTVLR